MTDLAISEPAKPHRRSKERPLRVTGKVAIAVHAMVWQGLKRDDAAQVAGMKDNSLYVALRKPDVRAFYLAELEILRTSERAQNIHRLVAIRDKAENMPAVQAIAMLERMSADNPTSSGGSQQSPGVTIHIHAAPSAVTYPVNMTTIEQDQRLTDDPATMGHERE